LGGNVGLVTSANGFSTSASIAWSGASPAELFQSEAWDATGGAEMLWEFPVTPGGTYELRIYLADIYSGTWSTGARVFDVLVEDVLVLDNQDIYDEVGANTGLVKTFVVPVDDDLLSIEFLHVVENPKVAGFEVIDLGG